MLDEVARFYIRDMNGRVRHDGPGARIKFTRDWEYPWALTRAGAGPDRHVLDCGAGYSPLPFLWSRRGATVSAIDRDSLVATRAQYARWCLRQAWRALGRDVRRSTVRSSNSPPRQVHRASPEPRPRASSDRSPLSRFLRYHWRENQQRLSRLQKPDFWGPVSPDLLRRYGVRYLNADFTALPFPSSSFDVVSCISVLEHLPLAARLAGLAEMSRVLKPGGRLIVTYDVIDGDITQSLLDASGCRAEELVYFRASRLLFAPNAPDVVGLMALK